MTDDTIDELKLKVVRLGAELERKKMASQKLIWALESAIEIIEKHVKPDALGADYMGDPEVPGGTKSWYALDEALHYMQLAIARSAGDTVDELIGYDGKRKPATDINFEAWSRTLVGFIRHKGLEQELRDWGGGWPVPISSKSTVLSQGSQP